MDKTRYIVGIDEAGRGPIAGPVAVGIFCVSRTIFEYHGKALFTGARDSKKLSVTEREAWYTKLKKWKKEGTADFAVCFCSAKMIDKKGIVSAIRSAMMQGLKKLSLDPKDVTVLLDGSLYAPKAYRYQKTIIGGDDKELVISLASIAAKASRDARMMRLAKKCPGYGFDVHKGYGTKAHYAAIKKEGVSEYHRHTFLRRFS